MKYWWMVPWRTGCEVANPPVANSHATIVTSHDGMAVQTNKASSVNSGLTRSSPQWVGFYLTSTLSPFRLVDKIIMATVGVQSSHGGAGLMRTLVVYYHHYFSPCTNLAHVLLYTVVPCAYPGSIDFHSMRLQSSLIDVITRLSTPTEIPKKFEGDVHGRVR